MSTTMAVLPPHLRMLSSSITSHPFPKMIGINLIFDVLYRPRSFTKTELATSATVAQPTCWEIALDKLTAEQRKLLVAFGIANSSKLEIEIETLQNLKDGCTHNLIPGTGGRNPVITRARIHNILKKMEKYAIIGDIALQQNPNIISLVWAGVRFCLQVCGERSFRAFFFFAAFA